MKNSLLMAATIAATTLSANVSAGAEADYMASCKSCHDPAIAPALAAPGFGDKAAWAPRIAKGMDALYNTAINGSTVNPVMMPRGGSTLSDDALKAVVDHMVAAAR